MDSSKKAKWSWALYDWANSAFSTTVMAAFFPLFLKDYWSTNQSVTESTWYLAIGNSTASIIVAALAPFLGAVADQGSSRKRFLLVFACMGIIGTGALWQVAQGNWQMAIFMYIIASVGFMSGNVFYDSLLPSVSTKDNVDSVSALAYGLGYIGGGLLFLINVLMVMKPEIFGLNDASEAIKLSFLMVAIWWAVFSIPIFLFVEEPKNDKVQQKTNFIILGWRQLMSTFKEIKKLKVVGSFLLAYWFYIDGVDTIIRMAADYTVSLGYGANTIIVLLLLVQFVAFPAILLYDRFSRVVGVKKALYFAIGAYCMICLFAYFVQEEWHIYVIAVAIGCFQGGIQSLSRSIYTRIITQDKAAEFFGFFNMIGKYAAIIGPPLMGYVGLVTGNPRLGIVSIIILFIAGGLLLTRVDIEEGERMANEVL